MKKYLMLIFVLLIGIASLSSVSASVIRGGDYKGQAANVAVPSVYEESPYALKSDAITLLASAKLLTNEGLMLNELNAAIFCIRQSLAPSLWTDSSHLDPRNPNMVFEWETVALLQIMAMTGSYNVAGNIRNIISQVVAKLLQADESLVQTVIGEALTLGSTNPAVLYFVGQANAHFSMGATTSGGFFTPLVFEMAWNDAETALSIAK